MVKRDVLSLTPEASFESYEPLVLSRQNKPRARVSSSDQILIERKCGFMRDRSSCHIRLIQF
jgi:hypothetical protein